MRRRVIWGMIYGYLGINLLMFLRFFFPRALYEPNTIFNIGYPADFCIGDRPALLDDQSRLDHSRAGPDFRDFCPLHAPGMHSGMEAGRE